MDWRDRIVCNPDIPVGRPTVKGKRLSVDLIPGWLACGWTHEMLIEAYPQLSRDDILAALAFAVEKMREESCTLLDRSAAWALRCWPTRTDRSRRCWRCAQPGWM